MNATILNKRKKWLSEPEGKELDTWTKAADKLDEPDKYFGIRGALGQLYQKDDTNTGDYFKKSLALFKKALELQKNGNAQGLPKLEIAERYDALITIVGFSPQPLLHTILALAPSSVYPIATDESAKEYGVTNITHNSNLQYFEKIVELYKESEQKIEIKPIGRAVESIGSIDTFKRVREIIAEIKSNKPQSKIAIDITGGKKSADASAFLTVAIEKDIDIFYVDFEEYKDGKPLCGTEFLNKLENPYDLYNVDLINQAKELFKNHNYPAAVSIFKQVEERLANNAELFGLQKELEAVKRMHTAAKFYAAWDAFEYEDAYDIQNLDILRELKELEDKNKGKSEKEWIKIYEVPNQFEYVKKIALDRFTNAERREAQGRYEDAITRYAQAVEIACKSKFIQTLMDEKCKPKLTIENEINGEKINEEKELPQNIYDWQADYASVSGIINWLLCIQKIKWKVEKLGTFQLEKYNNDIFKKVFCSKFNLDYNISARKLKEESERITDAIEIRNNFIHVSTLSAKKEKMKKLKDFAQKMLEVIYGNLDFSSYQFKSLE